MPWRSVSAISEPSSFPIGMAHTFDPVTLRLFVAVCEERNIARATGREALVASAVSKRIAAVEASVGTALLLRGRRGIDPTAAGQALLRQAREVFSTCRDRALPPRQPVHGRAAGPSAGRTQAHRLRRRAGACQRHRGARRHDGRPAAARSGAAAQRRSGQTPSVQPQPDFARASSSAFNSGASCNCVASASRYARSIVVVSSTTSTLAR